MDLEYFTSVIDLKLVDKYRKGDRETYIEYAHREYMKKVKPYRLLISGWRTGDKRYTLEEIRIALDLPNTLFTIYKSIPEFIETTDLDKDLMTMKAHKDLIDGIETMKEKGKVNAKLLDIQLTRFDPEYSRRSKGEGDSDNVPKEIKFTIVDGSLSDEEIKDKSGFDKEE